jgi:hypothetical protein
MRSMRFFCSALVIGLGSACSASLALAQFEAPQDSLSFEDEGSIDGMQGELVRMRDSKSDTWVLKLDDATKVVVEGEADPGYLRPGVFVEFTGQIDRKGALQEPIEEIAITSAQGKNSMGLFAEDDEEGLKPLKLPAPGTYRIRGKVVSYRNDEMTVLAGRAKISGKTSDDLKVKVKVDDLSLASTGDVIKVKAWYYETDRPNPAMGKSGSGLLQEIVVTMSKRLEHNGKKPRQSERPARPVSKSRTSR